MQSTVRLRVGGRWDLTASVMRDSFVYLQGSCSGPQTEYVCVCVCVCSRKSLKRGPLWQTADGERRERREMSPVKERRVERSVTITLAGRRRLMWHGGNIHWPPPPE